VGVYEMDGKICELTGVPPAENNDEDTGSIMINIIEKISAIFTIFTIVYVFSVLNILLSMLEEIPMIGSGFHFLQQEFTTFDF
jgi:hypothetical protein